MQILSFYNEAKLREFLQTHANADVRVVCVESTGTSMQACLSASSLVEHVDDVLDPEYPKKHFTSNHARKIADYVLKACVDQVESLIMYSTGNTPCLNGILKAIYKTFGEDHKAATIMDFNALCYTRQLEHFDRLYRNADICLMHAAGETLTSIAEKYGLTKGRARQIPLESKPEFLYQSFDVIDETTAGQIIVILENRIPEFRSMANIKNV